MITLAVIAAGFAYLFFRIRTGLNSAIQVQKLKDGLYYMEYNGDYGFDRFLEQGGAASDLEVARFVGKDLFGGLVIPGFKTGKFGCSTLAARNEKGGVMYGHGCQIETGKWICLRLHGKLRFPGFGNGI